MRITIKRKDVELAFLLLVMSMVVAQALYAATPEGATNLTVVTSSTRQATPSSTLDSIAGNVSQLSITAYTQTQHWQGYYGNVTGTILLSDASGGTIYSWDTANPSGQIFASTSEVDFSDGNVECYNFSKAGNGYLNLSAYEASLGMTESSEDGINETFNLTNAYDPFYVSATYINETCPVTYLFNATNQSSKNTYQELLLYDLTANNTIFTSIIRPGGILGFNNLEWDFQMIVAEKGSQGDTSTTEYYFYISLE